MWSFQVDEGKVAYEQSVDSVGWAALDKFMFTVSSPPASLEAQTFDIDISYENAGPEQNSLLLQNTGMIKPLIFHLPVLPNHNFKCEN